MIGRIADAIERCPRWLVWSCRVLLAGVFLTLVVVGAFHDARGSAIRVVLQTVGVLVGVALYLVILVVASIPAVAREEQPKGGDDGRYR